MSVEAVRMVRMFAVVVCVSAVAVAAPVPKTIPVADVVRDLTAEDAKARDAAEAALGRRGFEAIAPLKEVAKGADKDAAARAERLLAKLEWGLYPFAPTEVGEAVERYRSRTDKDLRRPVPPDGAVVELIETVALLGKPGVESLRAISQTIADERGRGPERWQLVRVGVRRGFGRLLFDGKGEDAAAVLEAALPEWMARDVKASRRDRGLKVEEEKPPPPKPVVVANVFKNVVAERIAGDPPRKTDRAEILLLQGDPAAAVRSLEPEDRIRLLAARWQFADALNVRPTESKEANPDAWRDWAAARAELLYTVGRAADADTLLDDKLFTPIESLPAIRLELAHGRTDRAFRRVAAWLAEPENSDAHFTRWDKGQARTLWGYEQDPDFAEALFPGRKLAASLVWSEYRKDYAAESTLSLTRRLLGGTATKAEYADAMKRLTGDTLLAVARAAGDQTTVTETLERSAGLCRPQFGEAARPLGMSADDSGVYLGSYFAHAHTLRPILDYGRRLADQGKHKEAAAVYQSGWERFPNSPVLMYLSGRELTAAGDAKEGGKRTELAFRLPLGDGDVWAEFVQQLLLTDAPTEHLKRAADRLGERPPVSMWVGEKAFRLAAEAYRKCGAFDAAAKAEQRAAVCWSATGHVEIARLRRSGVGVGRALDMPDPNPLPHPADYLRLFAVVKLDRALESLAAKKPAEAKALAANYFALLPGDVAQAVRVIVAFDIAGAKKEADELFEEVRGPLAAAVKEYPKADVLRKALTEFEKGCGR